MDVYFLKKKIKDNFLYVNGDTVLETDINKLISLSTGSRSLMLLTNAPKKQIINCRLKILIRLSIIKTENIYPQV